MAVLSKTFEATASNCYVSLDDEVSKVSNKLFFETFPDVIVQLRASCSLSSCWEISYLLHQYLHRDMAVLEVNNCNTSRMAVPVFKSPKKYFKMIDLKDIRVIQHLAAFKTALTTLSFRDNVLVETIATQALILEHSKLTIEEKPCSSDGDGEDFNTTCKEHQTTEFIPSVGLSVLRLRGGASGDEESWLCDICGKSLVSTIEEKPDGLPKWKCSLCGNFLSSKQRVISHLIRTHGKTNFLDPEQKQTLTGNSRTTLWRRKRSANGCFVPEQSSPSVSFEEGLEIDFEHCSSILDESPVPQGASSATSLYVSQSSSEEELQIFLATDTHEDIETSRQGTRFYSKNNVNNITNYCSDSEHPDSDSNIIGFIDESNTSDSDCSMSSDTDYSSSETDLPTSSDESDAEEQDKSKVVSGASNIPPITEKERLSLIILSYIAKYKLSGSASVDLLDLLKLIAPEDNILQSLTLSDIKETLGDCIVNLYDCCGKCFSIFPKDETIYQCSTIDSDGNQCTGLRYRGNSHTCNQVKKQRNLYFVTVSVEQQLSKLLERTGIWAKIQQYKNTPNYSSSIRDIVDGTVYKRYKESGGFLTKEDNLTLLFNTDGIPLYKSSKVNIWPVFLAINVLPPEERFAKKNMILWGLWQGKGKPRFSTFFEIFTDDVIRLKYEGFTITNKCHPKLMLSLGTTDLQGKAYLMYMSHHNGVNGCLTCEEEGFVTK